MEIDIPELSVVVLIGPSGSGKSTFAKKYFLSTEILSSDHYRAIVSDDENNQKVTKEAFDVLQYILKKRLALGKLTVIDATNVKPEDRKILINIAREYHFLSVAIVFNISEKVCCQRNKNRDERNFGAHVIRKQRSDMRRNLRNIKKEGFTRLYKLKTEDEVNQVVIKRVPLWNNRKELSGPFDIIGDIHGCYKELCELLEKLGYIIISENSKEPMKGAVYSHPDNRKIIFLGDFVDRGPDVVKCIKLVYNMVNSGNALCVPGNHEIKLIKFLSGKNVQVSYGLAETIDNIDKLEAGIKDAFKEQLLIFLKKLISHYVLDNGKLVVSHAGIKEEMQGRGSGKVKDFCLYGETTGEIDEYGLPVRYNWAYEYRGYATVVYGHTPVPEAEWLNNTINIDTGCVFGGKLTALKYPEKEIISVKAKKIYCESHKPFLQEELSCNSLNLQQKKDELLDIEDVIGKKIISTRLRPNIIIKEANSSAALEVISRFSINPKWLIYLPPTMSPGETSYIEEYLEFPVEAFNYYRSHGVGKVVCEEKHMGSRAVVIVCKNEEEALKHFGINNSETGIVYTRTGRRFFKNIEIEKQLLDKIKNALDNTDFWNQYKTGWVCFDCEIMPWSEKAQDLLKKQYAAVGVSAINSLKTAIESVEMTNKRNDLDKNFTFPRGSDFKELDPEELLTKLKNRESAIDKYIKAYRQYCWPVNSVEDLKIAPFHILAIENNVFTDKNHEWHMNEISKICEQEPGIMITTTYKIIDITDQEQIADGIKWWKNLTENMGEGMVVKPYDFIVRGNKGLIQPAVKCRGKEYLRIIYGAEYTFLHNLEKLKSRSNVKKQNLALKEFSLGIEALERFVRKEPLRRVNECVFSILALEVEPVDPRL